MSVNACASDYDSLMDMSLEELLGINVSIASKFDENVADAPSTVTVFTGVQIRQMGIGTVEELLNYVPGFQTARTEELGPVTNVVSSRGRRSLASSPDILFLVDGVRINDSWYGGAVYANFNITTRNVKQVEVIRGPGSALYGSNAFMGVVNIVTDKDGNSAGIRVGEIDLRESYATLTKKTEIGTFNVFARSYEDTGDHSRDFPDSWNGPTETIDPTTGGDLQFNFTGEKLSTSIRHTRREVEHFWSEGAFGDTNDAETSSFSVNVNYSFVENKDLTAKIDVGYLENSADYFIFGIPAEVFVLTLPVGSAVADYQIGTRLVNLESHVSFDFSYRLSEVHDVIFGAGYLRAKIDETDVRTPYDNDELVAIFEGTRTTPPTYFNGEIIDNTHFGEEGKTRHVRSLYLQDKYSAIDDLSVTVGVRYDEYSDFGSTVNPRVGLVYKGLSDTTLKWLYGEAFRAPTMYETGSMNIPTFIANDNLTPEELKTMEFGLIHDFQPSRISVTYYYTEVDNVIRNKVEPLVGTDSSKLTPINKGKKSLSGIEAEGQFSPWKWLQSGITFTKSFKTEGDPQEVADTLYSAYANFSSGKLNFNISGYYHSEVESAASGTTVTLKPFTIVNSKLAYDISGDVRCSITINNLLNKEYRTLSSSLQLSEGIPGRGRLVSAGIEFDL